MSTHDETIKNMISAETILYPAGLIALPAISYKIKRLKSSDHLYLMFQLSNRHYLIVYDEMPYMLLNRQLWMHDPEYNFTLNMDLMAKRTIASRCALIMERSHKEYKGVIKVHYRLINSDMTGKTTVSDFE